MAVVASTLLVGIWGVSSAAWAQAPASTTPPPAAVTATGTANASAAVPLPTVTPPQDGQDSETGMDLRPHPTEQQRPITETWWFWAAAAGVVATTVAIVLVAGRSQEEPKTILGDMRAFR
ncbi:MAG: hypothetical protein SF187_15315 [Deltaproteobacteria bacterium]|nr:hypothetical protein [Deltaproteobacteria bacterium]